MDTQGRQTKTSTQKWLLGCGIGSGAIIVILIILGVSGFFFVKNIVDGFKDTEALMEDLTAEFGRVEDFCPDPDGTIRPERVEAFLTAREGFAPERAEVEQSFRFLSSAREGEDAEGKKQRNVVTMVRRGFGVIPQIAEFYKSRNQALLEARLGLGEYHYIYAMAYFVWLGKTPEDGPDVLQMDEGGWRYDEDEEDEEFREARRRRMLRRLNRRLGAMLKNQLAKLKEGGAQAGPKGWRTVLEAEVAALEADQYRLPWQEGAPEVIVRSLAPFRSRLEAGYSELANPLEPALGQR